MAEADDELPWDDQTDIFITNLDRTISKDYGLSLRELLINPDKYATTKDILDIIDKIRADIEDYFNGLRDSMKDEMASFTKALETADAQYTKINDAISTKAAFSRIPYIKPFDIAANQDTREEITIEQYNNAADALITKLINISHYVGDVSSTYGQYTIGSWIFSGPKVYVLSVYLPPSIITDIDDLNANVNDYIDTAYQQIKLDLGQ